MFATKLAVFLELELVWSLSFILCRRIIFSLTLRTIETHDNTHKLTFLYQR